MGGGLLLTAVYGVRSAPQVLDKVRGWFTHSGPAVSELLNMWGSSTRLFALTLKVLRV